MKKTAWEEENNVNDTGGDLVFAVPRTPPAAKHCPRSILKMDSELQGSVVAGERPWLALQQQFEIACDGDRCLPKLFNTNSSRLFVPFIHSLPLCPPCPPCTTIPWPRNPLHQPTRKQSTPLTHPPHPGIQRVDDCRPSSTYLLCTTPRILVPQTSLPDPQPSRWKTRRFRAH
jgi:hypothetical protein